MSVARELRQCLSWPSRPAVRGATRRSEEPDLSDQLRERVRRRRVTTFMVTSASVAALTCLAACAQPTPSPRPAAPASQQTGKYVQAHAVAGTILRVTKGQVTGELRITEESSPDGPAGPPYPACLTGHAPDERVVNFDLNWAGIGAGSAGPVPALTVTIAGPAGTPLIADIPQQNRADLCRAVRSFVLGAEGEGWQLVYGLTLKELSQAKLTYLWVTIDGHIKKITLSPVCSQDGCFQDDPPVDWTSGTSYSTSLTI
jgi:hypothetical protein